MNVAGAKALGATTNNTVNNVFNCVIKDNTIEDLLPSLMVYHQTGK